MNQRIYERSLRLLFNNYELSFYDLTFNKKTIHQRCINVLLTEVYKYLNNFPPELINEVFYLRQNHYNLHWLNISSTDNPSNKFMLNATAY